MESKEDTSPSLSSPNFTNLGFASALAPCDGACPAAALRLLACADLIADERSELSGEPSGNLLVSGAVIARLR